MKQGAKQGAGPKYYGGSVLNSHKILAASSTKTRSRQLSPSTGQPDGLGRCERRSRMTKTKQQRGREQVQGSHKKVPQIVKRRRRGFVETANVAPSTIVSLWLLSILDCIEDSVTAYVAS